MYLLGIDGVFVFDFINCVLSEACLFFEMIYTYFENLKADPVSLQGYFKPEHQVSMVIDEFICMKVPFMSQCNKTQKDSKYI